MEFEGCRIFGKPLADIGSIGNAQTKCWEMYKGEARIGIQMKVQDNRKLCRFLADLGHLNAVSRHVQNVAYKTGQAFINDPASLLYFHQSPFSGPNGIPTSKDLPLMKARWLELVKEYPDDVLAAPKGSGGGGNF